MGTQGSRMTDRFAEFVESFTFDQLPEPVVAKTKEILYDGLGCVLRLLHLAMTLEPCSRGSCPKREERRNVRCSERRFEPTVRPQLW